MYPDFLGSLHQRFDNFFRSSRWPFSNQQQQYYPVLYQIPPPVQPHHSTVVIINQPGYLSPPMQLPHNSPPSMPVPIHYNSYFSTTPSSRPIQINAPSARFASGTYNLTDRVMGLNFAQTTSAIHSASPVDSVYLMDFMDYDEQPHASSSHSTQRLTTDSIEEALRFASLTEDDKENTSRSISPSPKATSPQSLKAAAKLPNTIMFGPPGHRRYKRKNSYDDDFLINEETESEAGFSDDEDECMSNCGCVHTCMDSPIADTATTTAPFSRLGFRSVGDIIGYAQVVRAERLEALAELRNAVDKFNDMRQKNQDLRSKTTTSN